MNSKKPIFITTPIYYVNDKPHIGHAYTSIIADIICRLQKLNNKQVLLLTGTDEHGSKIEHSAKLAKEPIEDFISKNREQFLLLTKKLNLDNVSFISTTEKHHEKSVISIWNQLAQTGNIYLGKYEGWYSRRDESFYKEQELSQDRLSPTGSEVEWISEESYFFALSRWQSKLLDFYEENKEFIIPTKYRHEVINFIKNGLDDLSISRINVPWGISVPRDPKHTIYVWLDALCSYLSGIDYVKDEKRFFEYWPANIHIIGKDILKFHAIYWPAFLLAVKLPLPKNILVNGWWTNNGEKISKSLGNVIDPSDEIKEFGLDTIRYFLIRNMKLGNDGDYKKESVIRLHNNELVNKIGNFVHRSCSFVYTNCNKSIPSISYEQIQDLYNKSSFLQTLNNSVEAWFNYNKEYKLNEMLEIILKLVELGNEFIDREEPWFLKRNQKINKMSQIMYQLLELIRYIGIMLQPFIPDTAKKILNLLNIEESKRSFYFLQKKYSLTPNKEIQKPYTIFHKII